MSSTRTRIAASLAATAGIAALAAAPAMAATPDLACQQAGIATLKALGLHSSVAKNGITVGTAVSLGVRRATACPRASPSTRSSRSRPCWPTTAPAATASSSTPGAADPLRGRTHRR